MLDAVDNAGIAVSDVPRAVAFYTEILGFTDEGHDAESASLRLGEVAFWLFRTPLPATERRGTDFTANPPGLDHLSFRVADIDEACETLEARGVSLEGPTVGAPGEFRYRGFRDPDGTMLYVVERPSGA